MVSCFRKTRARNTDKGAAGSKYTVCVKKTKKGSKSASRSASKSASKSASRSASKSASRSASKSASRSASKSASPKSVNSRPVRKSRRVRKPVQRLGFN